MKIRIRNEEKNDEWVAEEITRDAFWNLYHPGCSEHLVIHKMRQHPDFLPELTFVIENDSGIIGSIFYSASKILTIDNHEISTVTFGPVSIRPDLHRQGYGRKLIEHSIKAAKQRGCRAIIILGYPYHYETYGFKSGINYGISMPDGKFYKGLIVLPLYKGALNGISGKVFFSDVLSEPDEEELLEFDRNFPYRGKNVQKSQKEFEEASCLLDE